MIILIDNYDSFTFNLYQYLGDLDIETTVLRNDACDVDSIINMNPKAIVISPGPGRPENAGLSVDLVKACVEQDLPLLGVCLGHQAIGYAMGAQIVQVTPKHGKTDHIHHKSQGIFHDIPNPITVTRYHSLVVEGSDFVFSYS